MRRILASMLALFFIGLAVPPASAEDTGSENYVVTSGVNPVLAVSWCITKAVDPSMGCIGGGNIYSTECVAIAEAGGDCDAQATVYQNIELNVVDALTGPNAFASACIFNPEFNTDDTKNWCDDGTIDGAPDAAASGCGIALVASSVDIHSGNHWANGFVYTTHVDPTTNQVCLGTSGTMNVVFS